MPSTGSAPRTICRTLTGWPFSTMGRPKKPRGHGGAPRLRREEGHDTRSRPLTVADAIADYLKDLRAARRQGCLSHPAGRRDAYPAGARNRTWSASSRQSKIDGLAPRPRREAGARARTKPGRKANHRKADNSADAVRKRRATANRILTVLKAALNHAWKAGHVASDDAWRRVKPFKAVETARVRYLSEAECVRLVNACEPAFRNLVRGALLTGCRYSELTAMHAADFNADAGVVTVRESKAGKPRHVVLTDEGQRLFATLTAGKLGSDPIFTRARRWRVGQVAPIAADAGSVPDERRSSRRSHSMCFGILMARRSPCAAFRWASSPNSLAMPTRG